MCKNCCQQPTQLKERPKKCTAEQIRECHGDIKQHPCIKENPASENE